MSEVSTFFRHCPSCGRRFEIRLVSKKLADDKTTTTAVKEASGGSILGLGAATPLGGYVFVEQDVPLTIDVEDFNYTYKCKHCGHVWTELHEKESKA